MIGRGLNDYDAIFRELAGVGFDGWISIEDGVDGIDEPARKRGVSASQNRRALAAVGYGLHGTRMIAVKLFYTSQLQRRDLLACFWTWC